MRKWLRSVLEWIKNLFCKKAMRRKISLYIADQLVDLDDQSFILFNYQMDDLSNPTIVKNSFSQQITLKGTQNNNKIFGHYFKTDRVIAYTGRETGTDFNASQKTPFTIYDEMGQILESGYVKLDSINRQGKVIQYKVTLYGGLGSFFYALSYDDNGNKRTLADLDYLGTGSPDTELNFAITAQAVQDAWARLYGDTTISPMWDVINFAPAYNGIPDNNFSPDKALVEPTSVGLQATIPEGGVNYTTKSGYCMVNMAQAQDEWAVKDLRSYLQRPVLSMKAFWDAICNPANNGGYEVDASIIQDDTQMGFYSGLWMTLPMITSLGAYKRATGDLSLTLTSVPTTGMEVARYDVVGSVPSGSMITADICLSPRFNMPLEAESYDSLPLYARADESFAKSSVIFIQVVAYDSGGNAVGGSKVNVITGDNMPIGKAVNVCKYTPIWSTQDFVDLPISAINKVGGTEFEFDNPDMSFHVEAQNVAYYKVMMSSYRIFYTPYITKNGDGSVSTPTAYRNYFQEIVPLSTYVVNGSTANIVTYETQDNLRSGAIITKSMLLSTSRTPAEYMLSFCKIFGLYFSYDNATKKVTILRRNDLYQDETIDLTRRVDMSQGVDIQPLVFLAKWYDFILEGVGGAFYDEYMNVEGIAYGIQRVNTGYDFNAESVNLMESVIFKNACTILAKSKYFNYIFQGQTFTPSPFLDKGNTYTLWSADGDTLETDISCPPDSATLTYYNDNPAYKGYDIDSARKLELRSADNKPIDGADVLVFLEGWNSYPYFKVTDDVPAMDILNDGMPCWLLGAGNSVRIPIFQRYVYGNIHLIEHSLDFGVPKQLDIPGVRISSGCTIYERGWKSYISDRYNANTKVMTCLVNFAGIPVSQDLLRKFFWFDNSLWVLNSIKNYSLTTYDPVECEFVQVQDKNNYLNGQSY